MLAHLIIVLVLALWPTGAWADDSELDKTAEDVAQCLRDKIFVSPVKDTPSVGY